MTVPGRGLPGPASVCKTHTSGRQRRPEGGTLAWSLCHLLIRGYGKGTGNQGLTLCLVLESRRGHRSGGVCCHSYGMSLASGNKYLVLTKRRALHTPGGTGRSLEHASHLLPASRWGRGHEDGAGPGAGRCTSRQLTQLSPGTDSFVRGRRREGCPSVRLSVCNSVSTREEEVCQNMKKVKR